MATGPEHYQLAERLLETAADHTDPTQIEGGWETTTDLKELETRKYLMDEAMKEAAQYIAEAQVHATLALAAATALTTLGDWAASGADTDRCHAEADGWHRALQGEVG